LPITASCTFQLIDLSKDVELETNFTAEVKKIGRVRAWAWNGTCGLGLMRVAESLEAKEILLDGARVAVKRPSWWPVEAPKKNAKKL
jgi:hypothetical protein